MKELLKQAILYKARYILLIAALVLGVVVIISAIMSAILDDDSGGNGAGLPGPIMCTSGKLDQAAISNMFSNAGVFTGKEDVFIQAAKNNGIDPVLLMAIAMHETGHGTSPAVKNKNNPGGLMNPDGSGLFSYSTLDEGINAMASNLNRLYISQGLITIEQIGNKYAPVGADNDPNNLNANWIPGITRMANSLGGLSANCSATATGEFALPVPGPLRINSPFGERIHPVTGKRSFHKGVDLACRVGDPIYAADTGTVVVTVKSGGGFYGHHLIIDHGGKYTLYGHLTSLMVDLNQPVTKGTQIATCGQTGRVTGPHLHFEVQTGEIYGQRQDPMPFLESKGEGGGTE
ncbi:M23 family metallopeptidase [Paenibacillus kribbensis]|uniref:M23 family metallopeptidase n=1 Tax=Paenibacillus kribbensis TaxID=172713 RepID=UPI002DB9752E|nr:M23 family metallopeptidase [Paenibacillus kribbensis]MEC0238222.1 M23 family metallopeptidase [Paenibacillus kribbensis]